MAQVRPAAGIILCRPKSHRAAKQDRSSSPQLLQQAQLAKAKAYDYEILMVQRSLKAKFFPGGWVFPGGAVDPADTPSNFNFGALKQAAKSPLFTGEHSFRIAAIRELLEEANVLLSSPVRPDLQRPATLTDGWFPPWCKQHNIVPSIDCLLPWARWITPEAEKRRFDTMFYVAQCPAGTDLNVKHDHESEAFKWFTPAEILSAFANGEAPLPPPTYIKLTELSECLTFDDVSKAASARNISPLRPVLTMLDGGIEICFPGDEKHDLGPGGKGARNRLVVRGPTDYQWQKSPASKL